MNKAMYAAVPLICKDLTDMELAVLNNVARNDFDPQGKLFDYERVERLFTEDGGTRMHNDTKDALAVVVLRRLG